MTIVTFNRKEFEKKVGRVNEKMQERITMFGTPIEYVRDDELAIEVFPNRPDLLSFAGFSRSFLALLGKKVKNEYRVKKSGKKLILKNLPKQWPYAFACIVKGISFNDERIKEVIAIQEKLGETFLRKRKKGGIGLYPLDKIQFPVQFVGKNPDLIRFRPLEFPTIITGRQILSQHPTGRMYGNICKEWNLFPVFVDATGTIMSMPPIINSHYVGKIDSHTKDIFIEATGSDPIALKQVIIIIVTALADMGGEIYSVECVQLNGKKVSVPDLSFESKEFSLVFLNKTLGTSFSEGRIKKYLAKMGIGFLKKKKKTYALIPPYRTDILHEIDLAEDVAIAHGYENFEGELPSIATIGKEDDLSVLKRTLTNILIGLGLLEVSSFHLSTKDQQFTSLGITEPKDQLIEVLDSKTERTVLRHSLLGNLLGILGENSDHAYPQKLFEIGVTFELDKRSETGINESQKLCICLCHDKANFTEIKQALDYVMKQFEKTYEIREREHYPFIDGRCGEIIMNGHTLGYIGEVHPFALRNNKIGMPVAAVEINLGEFVHL